MIVYIPDPGSVWCVTVIGG